jgi:hypothetical protein
MSSFRPLIPLMPAWGLAALARSGDEQVKPLCCSAGSAGPLRGLSGRQDQFPFMAVGRGLQGLGSL